MPKCPICKNDFLFKRSEIWVNCNGYKVELLDFGEHEVWLRYIENGARCSWETKKFLNTYQPVEEFHI
jgi:hypothetical protein